MKSTWVVIGFFLLLIAFWEAVSRLSPNLLFVLPPPSLILLRLWTLSDRFLFHTQITLKEMAGGFLLALGVAFPLSWLMDQYQSARFVLKPLFVVIQCIPMFALAPIMIIWFDWSLTAILIPTALMIFFPLTMSIYQGLRTTPKDLVDYFRINQATSWQIFFKLQLPWALPHIFGGFRIAAGIAGISAVAGEWAGGQAGLGVLMLESRHNTDLETTFGALICLFIISFSLYGITSFFEKMVSQRKPLKVLVLSWISYFAKGSCCLVLLGSCQPNEYDRNTTVLTLDWLPNPNHIPLYVGIEKGFFAKQGIHLHIKKLLSPADSAAYLTSKQCDLALCYMPRTMRLMARGANVLPIGILIKEPLNAFIFRAGEGIESPQDLNGKTIGYAIDGTKTTFLDAILESHQIIPVEKKNAGFDLVCCLGTKRVDVLYGAYWNIESEHLRFLGIDVDYLKFSKFGVPNYHELLVVARQGSLQTEISFIKSFQTALQESIDYSIKYPDEAFDLYFMTQLDKSVDTRSWEKKAWQLTTPVLADTQTISKIEWQVFHNWLEEHNLLN